jgi:hypothetical protein
VITATQVRALVMDADEFAQMVEEVPDVKARIDAAALERGN